MLKRPDKTTVKADRVEKVDSANWKCRLNEYHLMALRAFGAIHTGYEARVGHYAHAADRQPGFDARKDCYGL